MTYTYAADRNRVLSSAISYYLGNVFGNPPAMTMAQQYENAMLVEVQKELAAERDTLVSNTSPAEYPKLLLGPRASSRLVADKAAEDDARTAGFVYPAVPSTADDAHNLANPAFAGVANVSGHINTTDPGRSGFIPMAPSQPLSPADVAAKAPLFDASLPSTPTPKSAPADKPGDPGRPVKPAAV
jgi:hypothetical protein